LLFTSLLYYSAFAPHEVAADKGADKVNGAICNKMCQGEINPSESPHI